MSKRIIVSLGFCTLLSACALNPPPVAAQAASDPAPAIRDATTGLPKPDGASAVAVLQPSPTPLEQREDAEPESELKAGEVAPVETVAAPPPLPPCPASDGALQSRVAEQICQRVRIEPLPTTVKVENRELRTQYLIPFYVQRDYRAAWLSADGKPRSAVDDLIKALGEADREGLRPADYHRAELQKLLSSLEQGEAGRTAEQLADADLLFTDAYLTYASHLLSGRLSPRKVDPEWAIPPRSRDLAETLREALANDKVMGSLRALAPQGKGYVQLRDTLHRYRKVEQEGGWPMVGAGASGKVLRIRLQASGDLADVATEPGKNATYDKAVTQAVRDFQRRHGLAETGKVNAATLAALNVPVSERIRQIELNMERWRWLPDDFGTRYILVNIPSFRMSVIENGKPVIESNVVVGRQERQTPTFTANMAYLVLSPKWYVPRSIAVKDKLPKLRRNAYALAGQGIRIYNSAGQQIDPGGVNWSAVGAGNFNYQLRQDAGPRNALGGIKFMFPNPYNVYLHDTPSRSLFSRSQRTFSSGCIRISNPVELAEYLLKHDPKWSKDAIKTAAASGKQRVVNLPQEVPVYLLYWTVWADENGDIQFRDDIYQRDKSLKRALYQEGKPSGGKGA
ncbi:MAG: L,D-transpeptidase family protein [Candidatus Contendobacter sp.]|nr:L,D-transpeptidase family protein [Gammaproteobacteria bacterium]MCC8994757.1 L,D-transpeptidase family protein [Candidatus Contendobacter sp.]